MKKHKTYNDSCAIFVSSCDAYEDAWAPFFTLFFKYWPDCPFPVYLISNNKKYNDERVIPVNITEDAGWAQNLKTALKNNPYKYIIYFQEDYFLKRKVNTQKIISLLEILKKENAAYLRLCPSPGPDKKFKNYTEIGEINNDSRYRTSLQVAIWDASVLDSLLWENETGADFELIHNKKLEKPFLCVNRSPLFPYVNTAPVDYVLTGIQKRKWNRAVLSLFKKENIFLKSEREFESKSSYIQQSLSSLPFIGRLVKQFYRIKYKIKSLF